MEQFLHALAGRLAPVDQTKDAPDVRQGKAEPLGSAQETERRHLLVPVDPVAAGQPSQRAQNALSLVVAEG